MPWGLLKLYIMIFMLICSVAFSLGWYYLFMNALGGGAPWYFLFYYFLASLFVVPAFLGAIAGVIYFVCKGVIDFLSEAWKDFTVDVELPV
jgi:hypothetical protein